MSAVTFNLFNFVYTRTYENKTAPFTGAADMLGLDICNFRLMHFNAKEFNLLNLIK